MLKLANMVQFKRYCFLKIFVPIELKPKLKKIKSLNFIFSSTSTKALAQSQQGAGGKLYGSAKALLAHAEYRSILVFFRYDRNKEF